MKQLDGQQPVVEGAKGTDLKRHFREQPWNTLLPLALWPPTDARIRNDGEQLRLPRPAFLELLSAWKGASSRNMVSLAGDADAKC